MDITAPAKINLYLDVIRKRDDGYHEIDTLFERVSIFDTVTVSLSDGRSVITCDDGDIPTGGDSLLMRAISLFRSEVPSAPAFNVYLEKKIPVGAGLGGGSSDAAALLKGINTLSGCPLCRETLMRLGSCLGADVPFFLSDSSFAIGTGRGDIVKTLSIEARLAHIIVNPPFKVMTADVYAGVPAFTLTKKRPVDRMMSAFLRRADVASIGKNLHNDLQDIVLRDFPDLRQVFSELKKAGARGVLLSGSGPTVFGIFNGDGIRQKVENIRKRFPENGGWKVFEAYTC